MWCVTVIIIIDFKKQQTLTKQHRISHVYKIHEIKNKNHEATLQSLTCFNMTYYFYLCYRQLNDCCFHCVNQPDVKLKLCKAWAQHNNNHLRVKLLERRKNVHQKHGNVLSVYFIIMFNCSNKTSLDVSLTQTHNITVM